MPSRRKDDPRSAPQLAQVYGNVGKTFWQGSTLLPSIGFKVFCLAMEANLEIFRSSLNAFKGEMKKN